MNPQPATQQVSLFAEKVGALPTSLNAVESRAIGLPEATARLAQQHQYWIEHDGPEQTASAPGAKAAEKSRRYIQHLLDRGGDSAPKCPVFLELHAVQLLLKAQLIVDENGNQQQINHNLRDNLTYEEQTQLASLVPLTYGEALTYLPSLGRFQQRDVEEILTVLRTA
jgi:hypothetical protein